MDAEEINRLTHNDIDYSKFKVEVDGVTYKSQLEAKWAVEFARLFPGLVAVYEKARYRVRYPRPKGQYGVINLGYRPDFVLVPNGTTLRPGLDGRYKGMCHVELKPEVMNPENLLHLVGAPMVLICGYPDDVNKAAFIVFSESYRPKNPNVRPRRVFYPFGSDIVGAVLAWHRGDFDGMLHDRRALTRIT